MKVNNIYFYLDRERAPQQLHPFSHYLFREQASVFCYWLTKKNQLLVGLPTPISLRIEIVDPARPSAVKLINRSEYVVECPVPFERYATLPFKMVEGRMSKLFRARGLTAEVEMRPLFDAAKSNDLFLEILLSCLGFCKGIFQTDVGEIRDSFRKFLETKFEISWIKERKRFTEFGGMAELEYSLDAFSMRKEIILRRKGVEIDRSLVTEDGPEELNWAGTFPMKIEGSEVVLGYGTYRYEPFRGVRIVSLSP
jgi:hypothetical protein